MLAKFPGIQLLPPRRPARDPQLPPAPYPQACPITGFAPGRAPTWLAEALSPPRCFRSAWGCLGPGKPLGISDNQAKLRLPFWEGEEMDAVTRDWSPSYLASRVTTSGTGVFLEPRVFLWFDNVIDRAGSLCPTFLFPVGQSKVGKWACMGQMAQDPCLTQRLAVVYGEERILLMAYPPCRALKCKSQDLAASTHIGLT